MSLRRLKWRGIGRLELLAWVNEFLETDYTKIEHLADGIAYCQIFDALFPGKLKLCQVNFNPRSKSECESNFRMLRRTFQACDIKKEIPIRKLVDGVFQEHFEFLHWVHDFVHRTYPEAIRSYHGFERRQQVLGPALSLTEINAANTNLVPNFSNSIKFLQTSLASPTKINDSSYLGDLDGDNRCTSGDQSGHDFAATARDMSLRLSEDTQETSSRPTLQFVAHSCQATLQASASIDKLSSWMTNSSANNNPIREGTKKVGHNTPSSPRRSIRSSMRQQPAPADPCDLDLVLCHRIANVIDCLEAELLGRIEDLRALEEKVGAVRE